MNKKTIDLNKEIINFEGKKFIVDNNTSILTYKKVCVEALLLSSNLNEDQKIFAFDLAKQIHSTGVLNLEAFKNNNQLNNFISSLITTVSQNSNVYIYGLFRDYMLEELKKINLEEKPPLELTKN